MTPVVPRPSAVTPTALALRLADGAFAAYSMPALEPMVRRFAADLLVDTGLTVQVGPSAERPAAITVEIDPTLSLPEPDGVSPTGTTAEGYRFTVDPTGLRLVGTSPEGAFRGLTTLRQLLARPQRSIAVEVTDSPRFAWRGLSLDVVRTFFTVAEVKQVIDVCALYKLNVLHLHLSDDQGWRLEMRCRPKLAMVGGQGAVGNRPGGFYTHADYAELYDYAADRFVTIIPEIDMPGHCAAVLRAYPELASPDPRFPGNVLDPTQPEVAAFVREVVQELAAITPAGFLHIGGDEAFGMSTTAYQHFIGMIRPLVTAAGKRVIGWQEITRANVDHTDLAQYWFAPPPAFAALLDAETAAPESLVGVLPFPVEMLPAVLEMFRSARGDLARAAQKGTAIILSPSSKVYLDTPYAEASAEARQNEWQRRLGLPVYPRQTIAEMFDWDPATLPEVQRNEVVGIEAAMWCETVASFDELMFMLLPRLAGIAEKAWSRDGSSTWDDYRARLAAQQSLWSAHRWPFFASSLVDWSG